MRCNIDFFFFILVVGLLSIENGGSKKVKHEIERGEPVTKICKQYLL